MYRMVTGLNDGCAPPPLRDLWLFPCPLPQMVVTTGLLDLLSSKDELAAVLAHETAHVLARHHVSHSCLWESNALQELSMHYMPVSPFLAHGNAAVKSSLAPLPLTCTLSLSAAPRHRSH